MEETMMIISIGDIHEHSQGGEGGEMDIMGYQTKNFRVCPTAEESFSSMIKEGHRGEEKEMLINLAMLVDEYLGMEIKALQHGANQGIIEEMVEMGNNAMFHLGVLASRLNNESMISLFDFMPEHVTKALGMYQEKSISLEDQEYDMPIEDDCGC